MSVTKARKRTKNPSTKDEKLWPAEEKAAKSYKQGKLAGKRFKNVNDVIKDLNT